MTKPATEIAPKSIGTELAYQRGFKTLIDQAAALIWDHVQASGDPLRIAQGEIVVANFKADAWTALLQSVGEP